MPKRLSQAYRRMGFDHEPRIAELRGYASDPSKPPELRNDALYGIGHKCRDCGKWLADFADTPGLDPAVAAAATKAAAIALVAAAGPTPHMTGELARTTPSGPEWPTAFGEVGLARKRDDAEEPRPLNRDRLHGAAGRRQ
jgi:hypothetical protein